MTGTSGLLPLLLCVNHWTNGAFTGRCFRLHLGGRAYLTLVAPPIEPLRCRIEPRMLVFGGWRGPHPGKRFAVDHWCWEGIQVGPACAAAVLNEARANGYTVFGGAADLLPALAAGRPLQALDFAPADERGPLE